MKVWFPCFVQRMLLLPSILLLAFGLPGQAQDRAALEQQLTERVDQLYQLFVSGEWRKVEPYVAEESQDIWLAQAKSTIDTFEIKEAKVAPDGKRADVTMMVTFRIPQVPNAPIRQLQKSEWLFEKGQWVIKLTPPPSMLELFKMSGAPSNPPVLKTPLMFDQNPVKIPLPGADSETVVKVAFQNVTPNIVTLEDLSTTCPCLRAEVDKTVVYPDGKGVLTLTYHSSAAPSSARPLSVQAMLAPSMYYLDLPVEISEE